MLLFSSKPFHGAPLLGEKLTPCLTGRALPDLTRETKPSSKGFLG